MTIKRSELYRPLGDNNVHALQVIMTQMAVDFALYGLQTTLCIAAIIILVNRPGRARFTLAVILGLLLSSTTITVANAMYYLVQFPAAFGSRKRSVGVLLYRLDVLNTVAHDLNYILSDAVLVWRAWCLWPNKCLVRGLLLLCVCGSVAGCVIECAWLYWPALRATATIESTTQVLTRLIPLLFTNIVATVLIGTKALQYRREIKGSLGLLRQKTQAETVLMLLLETGVAYILFWVIDCVVWTVKFEDPFSSVHVFTAISHHIAGIYPTCVLFAAIRGTTDSLISGQMSLSMRFARPPRVPERASEVDATIDPRPGESACVLDVGARDPPPDILPEPSRAHCGETSPESSGEGIVELRRESSAL